ncbi:hypothetical protein N431DRAFT_440003 [Stipitochalara longipes BDJ]|nr:hypothetical protein N431DRAFT_440003 [Stipitochalara longipes BDJ]
MRRTILSNPGTRDLRHRIRCGQPSLRIRLLRTAAPQTLDINGKKISLPTGLFINNDFVPAIGRNTFGVENPTNGQQLIQIQEGREEDVDIAVKVMRWCSRAGRLGEEARRGSLYESFIKEQKS